MREILADHRIQFQVLHRDNTNGLRLRTWQKLTQVIYGKQFAHQNRLPVGWHLGNLRRCGALAIDYRRTLDQHMGQRVLVWERTRDPEECLVATKLGYRVIGVPHNIEALVRGQDSRFCSDDALRDLSMEVNVFKKCAQVFCISREEQWLLHCCGISAEYLPYWPPSHIERELLAVRERRPETPQQWFLILGNVRNPPTRHGAQILCRMIRHIRSRIETPILMAGFGSEDFQSEIEAETVKVYGTVSSLELGRLLAGARALLMYQESATGVLTRIPEALLAGVPIIGNSIACRSALGFSGIHLFDGPSELADLLNTDLPDPAIPPRDYALESAFVKRLTEGTPSDS